MNKVITKGRLTKMPEIRTSGSGTKVAMYTLAVDRFGEGADFIQFKAFGKGAEFAEKYLDKGMMILVEGHIQTGSYQDNDGKTHYTTDIIADRHEFCEGKKDSGFTSINTTVEVDEIEELPFL